MILIDTNVISELMRAAPAPRVLAWVNARPASSLFVSSITQAEILYGIARLPKGRRRDLLGAAAAEMFERDFAGRVLPFDGDAARKYAEIASLRARRGRPIAAFDAQIAAISASYDAQLATRNVDDFHHCGIEVVNPWLES